MIGKYRMKPCFSTGELKARLEKSLGFGLRSLECLKSVNAVTFKAVRAGDGFAFAVRCVPERQRDRLERLIAHLREMAGSKAVTRLFERECPPTFRGYSLICLTWHEGRSVSADRLSEQELIAFLDDYRALSDAMQRATHVLPQYPFCGWHAEVLGRCRGFWGGLIRPLVEMVKPELTGFRADRLRVTHGDLHPGNFSFFGGRVSGFFDIGGFTWGYPAWDIMRYFVFSGEHLRWYEYRSRRRLFGHFRTAVRHMGCPREEWIASINAHWLEKLDKKTHGRKRIGPLQAIPLLAGARLYRRFLRIASYPDEESPRGNMV